MALAPATATSSAARAASFRQRCHREKVVGEGENFTPHKFNIDTKIWGRFFLDSFFPNHHFGHVTFEGVCNFKLLEF